MRYKPYGPWDHVPPHVWAVVDDPSTTSRDDCDEDDEDVCALCCHKHTTTVCGQCKERYPPPPCISYAVVQATVGVGTVIIVYVILIVYEM